MRRCLIAFLLSAVGTVAAAYAFGVEQGASDKKVPATERWVNVPMPVGFKVIASDADGPVFADAQGKTLYQWPFHSLRAGTTGEIKGKPLCYGNPFKETAGLMSPYPAGILLADANSRPACTDLWAPARPAAGAVPVGKWSILPRTDGTKQWAYDEQPLYTSSKDHAPGDVNGAPPMIFPDRESLLGTPAYRLPVGPPPAVAPGLRVDALPDGRMLVTDKDRAVYWYEKDSPTNSACDESCAREWQPLIASQMAVADGEWSIIERARGERQWVFRGHLLYTYLGDTRVASEEGSDVPGWHNLFTQPAPNPPPGFTLQDTIAGSVIADPRGRTVYMYNCSDDSRDQLACDSPEDNQTYRLAICGAGDAAKCQEIWPYVTAAPDAQSGSHIWSVMLIDPVTGRRAKAGQAGAQSVWAYRDRPIYTFSGDKVPGDVNGDGRGEWRGFRNGFRAMWSRLDLLGG